LLIELDGGQSWRLEKNEVVSLKPSSNTGTHHMPVHINGQKVPLVEFIVNGEKVPPSLWVYSPVTANW